MKAEVLSRKWCGYERGSIVDVSERDLLDFPTDLKPLAIPKPQLEPKPEPKKKKAKRKEE